MANSKIQVIKTLPSSSNSTVYVVGLQQSDKSLSYANSSLAVELELPKLDFAGLGLGSGESIYRMQVGKKLIALIAMPKEVTEDSLRQTAGAAVRQLLDFETIVLLLPTKSANQAVSILDGATLANYEFVSYKSAAKPKKLQNIQLVSDHPISAKQQERISVLSHRANELRNLVNSPANDLYPEALASWATINSKSTGLKIEIWDEKRLEKENCGGIIAVGKGSARPPRLVKISYAPKGAKKTLALVGKGITFDTGGLSLKPAASMGGMKYDMTGAATVLNAVLAIAALKLNVAVTAYACIAENMPSGTATRPNDVIKIRNGKTVEVMNTDAEGRLVLADGLSLASETKPDLIVDVATLTGAATVALGRRIAGLMGSNEAVKLVQQAAAGSGELVWPMPLPAELRSVIDSPIADIANAKLGNSDGGMLIGGLFLKEFIGNDASGKQLAWAHLDIAGPANNDREPWGYTGKGATATMLRTLVQLAENLASA
jgi:leucyl aminopeptidase